MGLIGLFFHDIFVGRTRAPTPRLSASRRHLDAAAWPSGARRAAHSAPVGPPRRDLPAHERRRGPLARGAPGRQLALLYFSQQPRRRGRRTHRRVLPRRAAGLARHPARPRPCSISSWPPLRRRSSSRTATPPTPGADSGAGTGSSRAGTDPADGGLQRLLLWTSLRHGARVVHLRDRLDPHARRWCSARHAFVRTHALCVHPGHRARRLVDPGPRRSPWPTRSGRLGMVQWIMGALAVATLRSTSRSFGWMAGAHPHVRPHGRRLRRVRRRPVRSSAW